jgi:phosphatidylinositol alpha-1,6-mannosyltransferase
VLLTVGRLIRRKGAAWFAEQVLPRLAADVVYAVVGEGPEREAIRAAAERAGVAPRIRLLGRLSDDLLAAAYAASDIFVMPNIEVAGDLEGFGLVALEAAAAGLPVVAADLEGIADAVRDGENGILAPPEDSVAFAAAIERVLALTPQERRRLGERFACATRASHDWSLTARRYAEAIDAMVTEREAAQKAA